MANEERTSVTGLDQATNYKEAEYDLVKSLLEATEYQTDEDNITEVEIKRKGKFFFSFKIHPLSEPDVRLARKKATTMMDNPQGKKFPKIEKEFDNSAFNSWLIYLATVPEDQETIWGNKSVMSTHNLMQAWESVDKLLTVGEKRRVSDLVTKISGLDDDEDGEGTMDDEEFAKN